MTDQPTPEPLRSRIAEAIEDAIYEHRERACQWGETDGTTQEIARRATNAVMAVVDPSPPPLNLPRETVATLHDMLGRLLAANPTASSDTTDSTALREQYAALAFNAVAPALKAHDRWLPLTVRQAVAAAVLAVRDREHAALKRAHVALAEQAGRDQAALKRLRERVQAVADEARGSVRDWLVDALADLDDPRTPDGGPTIAEAAADDKRWPLEKAGE